MISEKERALIYKLIEELTGATTLPNDTRQDSLINNVERRMREIGVSGVVEYLKLVDTTPSEFAHLISNLTIHTTSWFRENPHFVAFQEILLEALEKDEIFKVWCAACSTGEEVYSFALILEEFRRVHPKFEYRVVGTDIDAISLAAAERAVYPKKHMGFHVMRYKNHVLEGSGKTADYFTLSKEIRNRCTFRQYDLRGTNAQPDGPFHVCICRNVLIYFAPDTVGKVVQNLLSNVSRDGHLMLGHSEAISAVEFGLVQRGHSVYSKRSQESEKQARMLKPRLLCLEGSSTTRRYYTKIFADLGFDPVVVGTASEATTYLNFNDVDLITVDLRLADMSGDRWVQMERNEGLRTPVVMLSEMSSGTEVADLLALGAQDYIDKEKVRSNPEGIKEIFHELIRAHSQSAPKAAKMGGARPTRAPDVVMIGASTGGPQALAKVLSNLPSNCPPVLVTQHMSPKFTQPLAERLCELSGLKLAAMENGTKLLPGHLYFAMGDYHIGIAEDKAGLTLVTSTAAAFNGHRPSVDFMYNSALGLNAHVMGILLTGMGRDGALGLRFLRKEGAYCVAQSEEDCIVFGMPKEAIEREAADFVGNLDQIRQVMTDSFYLRKKKSA
jgi:chemotaxis response regulator CheB/chemotaxis methyl-accepting protein methylase